MLVPSREECYDLCYRVELQSSLQELLQNPGSIMMPLTAPGVNYACVPRRQNVQCRVSVCSKSDQQPNAENATRDSNDFQWSNGQKLPFISFSLHRCETSHQLSFSVS